MPKASLFIFIFTFFLCHKSPLAAEDLESFWLGKLPEVLEQASEIKSADIKIQSWNESALFIFDSDTETIKLLCHFHSTTYYHCSRQSLDFSPPVEHKLILDLPAETLDELTEELEVPYEQNDGSVWPWIVGAVAIYYLSKKVINYWIHKSFKPQPHSHEFSLLSSTELEDAKTEQLKMVEAHTQDLVGVFNTDLNPNFLEKEKVRATLESRILNLNKKIIDELVGSYCTTCKVVHSPQQPHHFSANSFSATNIDNTNSLGSSNLAQSFAEQIAKQMKPQKPLPFSPEKASNPKTLVQYTAVLRAAKALVMDLHRELVQPIPKILKSSYNLISKKENLSQVSAYAQTKYNTSIGESNLATGIAIASSLVTIKVLGESLETMIVGPYHVFCQLSDVAAITTGLVFLATYHSLRQPLKQKKPELLITKRFWSLMLKKLKNPTLDGKLQAAQNNPNFTASEALILELAKLKQQMQKWIWQLHASKALTRKQASLMARRLGQISKQKEDVIFALKMNSSYNPTELLDLTAQLKPIYQSYQSLFNEIATESEKTLKLQNTRPSSAAGGSCRSLLS